MATFYDCISYRTIESHAIDNQKGEKKKDVHCGGLFVVGCQRDRIEVFKLKINCDKQLICKRRHWSSGIIVEVRGSQHQIGSQST